MVFVYVFESRWGWRAKVQGRFLRRSMSIRLGVDLMSCLHISRLKEPLLLLSILSHRLTPEISLTSLSAAVSFKHDINTYTHGRSSIALLFDLDRLYGFWRPGVNLHLEKPMCYSIAQLVKKRHYSQNNRASAVELKLAVAGSLGAQSCVLLSWE